MGYVKQNFQNGQRLTAECLNRIEEGIIDAEKNAEKIANSGVSMLGNKEIPPRTIEFVEMSVNLFNMTDSKIQKKVYLDNGAFYNQSSLSYCVTHPIYMEAGVQYKWKHNTNIGTKAFVAMVDYTTLDIYASHKSEIVETDGTKYELFTPTVSGHYVVNFDGITARIKTFMVCKAEDYPGSYVSYGYQIHAPIPAEYIIGDDWLMQTLGDYNPLYGKSITLNGDSICTSNGGYGKIIADRNAMTYENKALGGATITAETYGSETGTAKHWVCRTISSMNVNADYAIVEGGVNDAAMSVPLGAITSNFTDALDDTTFYGAFEFMLKQLTIRFAGKKIGYIAVHKMQKGFKAEDDPATSYYWAAKKCCEKWGVPFLDLNTSVPPFAYFSENGDADLYALRTTYTQSGDGWHPTEEGFKKYYCDKIEAWMKAL